MDTQVISAAVAVVVPVVGALAWLMSIHGRVTGHDREIRDVKDDVRYIRERIDKALNGHGV